MVKAISRDFNMENKNKVVANTILDNISNTDIITMKDRLGKDVFHFDIRSVNTGARGTGSDESEEIAFLKAQSELIERLVYIDYQKECPDIKSSNGFAAHSTLDQAKESAHNELLERDIFLTTWLTGKYPDWTMVNRGEIDKSYINSQINLFSRKGFQINFAHIGNCNSKHCVLASLKDKKNRFGFVLATAVDASIDNAIRKVIIDQRRVATYLMNSFDKNDPVYQDSFQFNKPIDQQNYYLNPDRAKEVDDYFHNSNHSVILPNFSKAFIEFKLPDSISSSIKVVQCISSECQDYFIGDAPLTHINKKRIGQLGELELKRRIHPLG